MDLASGKIELSERYIQKLMCGHTLQSYNAVVLWRNNGIRTPSVTAANISVWCLCDKVVMRIQPKTNISLSDVMTDFFCERL